MHCIPVHRYRFYRLSLDCTRLHSNYSSLHKDIQHSPFVAQKRYYKTAEKEPPCVLSFHEASFAIDANKNTKPSQRHRFNTILLIMALHIFLFIVLLVPSFLEGLGLIADRRIFLLLFSSLSAFFYIYASFSAERIKIPLKATALYILFLLCATLSSVFSSLDKQLSFELLLLYYSSFILFLFFYNYKTKSAGFAAYFPFILGIGFMCYSLLLPLFKQKGLSFLLPVFEKQFVFASYTNHNHLGDFLGLFLVILAYFFLQKKRLIIIPLFIISFIFFIGSYSRSAYLSFFITFVLVLLYARKYISSLFLPLLFIFLSSLIFISYLLSFQQPISSPLFQLQSSLKTALHIELRDGISGHDIYLKQAVLSIQNHPLLGIGGGNFIIASRENIINTNYSDSAHSLFFELATEQGILATICFLLFVVLIVRSIFLSPSLPGFLFLYLLLNFQTDYTYQLYSLFLLWIVLSALSHSEKKEVTLPVSLYGILCIIPLIVVTCIMTSALFLKMGNLEQAIRWYPLNKEAVSSVITQSGNKAPMYIQQAHYIAPYDLTFITASADFFLQKGDKQKALANYEKVYSMNHLCSFYFVEKIYFLKRELVSAKEANQFLNKVVHDYQSIFATDALRNDFAAFCKKAALTPCPKVGWNE